MEPRILWSDRRSRSTRKIADKVRRERNLARLLLERPELKAPPVSSFRRLLGLGPGPSAVMVHAGAFVIPGMTDGFREAHRRIELEQAAKRRYEVDHLSRHRRQKEQSRFLAEAKSMEAFRLGEKKWAFRDRVSDKQDRIREADDGY